jgi:hypothetical protein
MEVLHSSEMSVPTRAKCHNIPEDCILCSHCCENLKSDIFLVLFVANFVFYDGTYLSIIQPYSMANSVHVSGICSIVIDRAVGNLNQFVYSQHACNIASG